MPSTPCASYPPVDARSRRLALRPTLVTIPNPDGVIAVKLLNFLPIALLTLTPTAGFAQLEKRDGESVENAFSKAWHDCVTYGEVNNTIAISDDVCSDRELRLQDARLNQAWKMVMARLPVARKTDLRSDQRNWIAARDKNCEDEDSEKFTCLIYETIKRTRYLERVR